MNYKKFSNKLEYLLSEIDYGNKILQNKLNISVVENDIYDQKLIIVCLYYSILDMSKNVLILLKNSIKPISIPIIIRSIFEALIEMINIIRNKDYIKKKAKNNLENDVSQLINLDKRLLKLINEKILNIYIEDMCKDVETLSGINSKHYTKKELLRNLNIEDQYDLYKFFCDHAHNNFNVLRNRYIKLTNDKLKISYSKIEKEYIFFSLRYMIRWLLAAVIQIHLYLDFNQLKNHNLSKINIIALECITILDKKLNLHN